MELLQTAYDNGITLKSCIHELLAARERTLQELQTLCDKIVADKQEHAAAVAEVLAQKAEMKVCGDTTKPKSDINEVDDDYTLSLQKRLETAQELLQEDQKASLSFIECCKGLKATCDQLTQTFSKEVALETVLKHDTSARKLQMNAELDTEKYWSALDSAMMNDKYYSVNIQVLGKLCQSEMDTKTAALKRLGKIIHTLSENSGRVCNVKTIWFKQ